MRNLNEWELFKKKLPVELSFCCEESYRTKPMATFDVTDKNNIILCTEVI